MIRGQCNSVIRFQGKQQILPDVYLVFVIDTHVQNLLFKTIKNLV